MLIMVVGNAVTWLNQSNKYVKLFYTHPKPGSLNKEVYSKNEMDAVS